MTIAADPFDELLSRYSAEMQAVAARTRALVRQMFAGAREKVYVTGWSVAHYADGPKMSDVVLAISPASKHVLLLFANGVTLSDPDHLLEGTGKGMRHLKLRTLEDVDRPAVRALVSASLAARRSANVAAAG
jgi:hypothetical protein